MKKFKKIDKQLKFYMLIAGVFLFLIVFVLFVFLIPSKEQPEDTMQASSDNASGDIHSSSLVEESTSQSASDDRSWKTDTEKEKYIFEEINRYRSEEGLQPLEWGNEEAKIALGKCETLVASNKVDSETVFDSGFCYITQENVSDAFITQCKENSNIKQMVLNENTVRMGVSVFVDSKNTIWCIICFNQGT